MPDVSIIVCTLNEEKRIENCLRHLRAQQFPGSFEIVLADGRSEDRTVELAKPLVDQVVIENIRRISAERHAGARVARGAILAFTDADSSAPPDWLSRGIAPFADPRVGVVYGPVYFNDATKSEQDLSRIVMPPFQSLFHAIGLPNPIGSNLFVRKEIYDAIGGFNLDLVTCEDLDLVKRAQQKSTIVFHAKTETFVSARRVRKWGYLYYVYFHLTNAIRFHWFKKPRKHYEDIRD